MKTYIGVKIVHAEPMTLGAYNETRGWEIPANENPARTGYFLRYPDGYVSWSPSEIFDAAYREVSADERALVIGAPADSTFRTRLDAERADLAARLEKLTAFMDDAVAFARIDRDQRVLLGQQARMMTGYLDTLDARIVALDTPAEPAPPEEGEIRTTGGGSVETPIPFS